MTPLSMNLAGPAVERELDRLWQNQRASAHNLANIETPGFVGTRVEPDKAGSFSSQLDKELARTDRRHFPTASLSSDRTFSVKTVEDLSADTELAEVSRTQVQYQTYLDVVNRRDRLIRTALDGK